MRARRALDVLVHRLGVGGERRGAMPGGAGVGAIGGGTEWQAEDEADALLVVGSSLAVFSGYRFTLRARDQGKPIVLLGLGPTRADDLATVKLDGRCGDLVPRLCSAVVQGRA